MPESIDRAVADQLDDLLRPAGDPTAFMAATRPGRRSERTSVVSAASNRRGAGRAAVHSVVQFSAMDRKLRRLVELLDEVGDETVNTSVRLPVRLRDAAAVAAEMGLASSTSELTVRGLQDTLEAFTQRAVLDAHYRAHPEARPDLAEVALAAAEIDGNPLAAQPELIRRAAQEIRAIKDDPAPDDVLLYAAGLAAAA